MAYSIGQAAAASGISHKMIRHYEQIGLLPKVARTSTGYRQYSDSDIRQLQFIRRARDLGFSLQRIERLLDLWRDEKRHSADVKALTRQYIDELEQRIRQLQEFRSQLLQWVDRCHGDERADCSIISQLEASAAHPTSGDLP